MTSPTDPWSAYPQPGQPSPNARALARVIEAWEELEPGNYNTQIVEDWLNGPMKAAIDHARLTLRGPR